MSQLGGGVNGISPKQSITNYKDSSQTLIRKVVTKSWNTSYATGTYNNTKGNTTPFRAINNSGDFLSRVNYQCGGPNPTNVDRYKRKSNIGSMFNRCDGTNIPASSCNVKFVADSSDYITYRKQRAINQNYNDISFGGDESNASYVNLMAVRQR
jgi:hypothetical protein